jgi:uncharacterized tellurite resistance protein B-like protein
MTNEPKNPERAVLAEALLRAATVAMIADGDIASSEREILKRLSDEALFDGVDVVSVIQSSIAQCVAEGPDALLADVAAKLTNAEQRETAFSSCIAIVATDGKVTPSEQRMLRTLREALAIPVADAKRLAGPMASIFES